MNVRPKHLSKQSPARMAPGLFRTADLKNYFKTHTLVGQFRCFEAAAAAPGRSRPYPRRQR